MHNTAVSPEWIDYIAPVLPAILFFILIMSFVPEPARMRFNAILVAGAGAAYLSGGGLGLWELVYIIPATSQLVE